MNNKPNFIQRNKFKLIGAAVTALTTFMSFGSNQTLASEVNKQGTNTHNQNDQTVAFLPFEYYYVPDQSQKIDTIDTNNNQSESQDKNFDNTPIVPQNQDLFTNNQNQNRLNYTLSADKNSQKTDKYLKDRLRLLQLHI